MRTYSLLLVALLILSLLPKPSTSSVPTGPGPTGPFGWLSKLILGPVLDAIKGEVDRLVEKAKKYPAQWMREEVVGRKGYAKLKEGVHDWEKSRYKLGLRLGFIASYLAFLGYITGSAYYSLNYLKDDILENPSPTGEQLNALIKAVTKLIYPVLLLALVLLAFYLLFLSASPQQRAKAKLLFAKLLIAMVLVSLSPGLLNLLFLTSQGLTEVILAQGQNEADAAIGSYQEALWGTYLYILASYGGPEGLGMVVEKIAERGVKKLKTVEIDEEAKELWAKLKQPRIVLKEIGRAFLEGLRLEGKVSSTIPGLALLMLLIIAIYGFLAFRLLILHFLAVIFPFTIFAYFFEPLRRLGGTLLEQTLLWTLLQAFFALTLVTVGLTKMLLLMAGDEEVLDLGFICFGVCFFRFFDLVSCFFLMIGPIMMFMLMKKLVPPH